MRFVDFGVCSVLEGTFEFEGGAFSHVGFFEGYKSDLWLIESVQSLGNN